MQKKFVFVTAIIFAVSTGLAGVVRFQNVVHAAAPDAPTITTPPVGYLLISAVQITGGVGKTSEDFIELYNPNPTSVNLNGYRLVKRTATATTDSSIKSWTTDTTIPPNSFYLWANSTFSGISVVPDLTSSSTISDNNGVALRYGALDTGTIIDSVAWGTTTNSFTSSGQDNPVSGQSLVRNSLFDSDPGYSLAVSSPRNSAIQLLPPIITLPPPVALVDNSTCNVIDQTDPIFGSNSQAQASSIRKLEIDFTNIGTSTWAGDNYTVLITNAPSLTLPADFNVAPLTDWQTFTEVITPTEEGSYNYQWQLANNNMGFGQTCSYNLISQIVPVETPIEQPPVVEEPPVDPSPSAPPEITPPPVVVEPPVTSPPVTSPLVPTIRITEILPNPQGADPGHEMIELYNYGTEAMTLEGWNLDNVIPSADLNTKAYTISNVQIQPDAYLSITIPTGKFTLKNTKGDIVSLFNEEDVAVDSVQYTSNAPTEKSYSLINNEWVWTIPTLGQKNVLPVVPPIVVAPVKKLITPPIKVQKPVVAKKVSSKVTASAIGSSAKKVASKVSSTVKKAVAKVTAVKTALAKTVAKKVAPKTTTAKTSTVKTSEPSDTDQKPSNPVSAVAIALASLGAGALAIYRFGLGGLI